MEAVRESDLFIAEEAVDVFRNQKGLIPSNRHVTITECVRSLVDVHSQQDRFTPILALARILLQKEEKRAQRGYRQGTLLLPDPTQCFKH